MSHDKFKRQNKQNLNANIFNKNDNYNLYYKADKY